ncbi:MAG: hypothetical protein LBP68_01305 [Acidobacteriota bacterium]|jgi:hypothetical protein|nr:hypothetical protein [Acidobacteriota bacterium]
MKITPVKRYQTPRFPIQDVLRTHPELLRLVPRRWANAPIILSAMSLACIILAARDGIGGDAPNRGDAGSGTASATQSETMRVAPIFHHGAGRGVFGCMSTAAPIVLTEDEARLVIVEEAASAGIHFSSDGKTVAGVERPLTKNSELIADKRTGEPKMRRSRLVLDGTDQQRDISFEFVSREDLRNWEIEEYDGLTNSVFVRDNRRASELLQGGLAKAKGSGAVGVFYDPIEFDDDGLFNDAGQAKARKQTVQLLQQQVRDFIAWLKAEGII